MSIARRRRLEALERRQPRGKPWVDPFPVNRPSPGYGLTLKSSSPAKLIGYRGPSLPSRGRKLREYDRLVVQPLDSEVTRRRLASR
jgi:hypothetical protein